MFSSFLLYNFLDFLDLHLFLVGKLLALLIATVALKDSENAGHIKINYLTVIISDRYLFCDEGLANFGLCPKILLFVDSLVNLMFFVTEHWSQFLLVEGFLLP